MRDPEILIYRCWLFQLWHKDPRKDGTDDSCGWFKRPRHGDQKHREEIRSHVEFDWKYQFTQSGDPMMSTPGIVLSWFQSAAFIHFGRSHRKAKRFLSRHLVDILGFAENSIDSLHNLVTNRYNEKQSERIKQAADCVYGCILRWDQPWYKHARFHIHHWRFCIPLWTRFHHRFFLRCQDCQKRFNWANSDTVFAGNVYLHPECLNERMKNYTAATQTHDHPTQN